MTTRISKATFPPAGKSGRAMTVREVAELDNCSEKTVRRAIDAGLLKVTRIGPSGRAMRITRDAYETYHARLLLKFQWK